jgi:tetratricopeptide (TPR) repeat protein
LPKYAAKAQVNFAEMLHDQGDNLAAAEARKAAVRLIDEGKIDSGQALRSTPGEVRARMNYFYACHWREQGDRAKEKAHLDEAVRHDSNELDALIASHQLPDPEPKYHQNTLKLIERAADGLRTAIAESPEEARHYNQFAWLIGNTEGDLDEALRCARKAVELWPESGAYRDTLAHVHFARGELQQAVASQTKAAELQPYSGLITRKLRVFRDALDEQKKNTDSTTAKETAAEIEDEENR